MIAHLDMDCFFAAIEMRERPHLANRPIAVGGSGRRGVLTTCNYKARSFGLHSAMPGFIAKKLCPEVVFLPIRGELYHKESQRIRKFIAEAFEEMEMNSIDEAYFRVSEDPNEAWQSCLELRQRIKEELGLEASIGIAPNRMLAKISSDWKKPNGQFMVRPSEQSAFIAQVEVKKIPGIGPKAQKKMNALGVHFCRDLQRFSCEELRGHFGQWGLELYDRCRGFHHDRIGDSGERKSLSMERTTFKDIEQETELIQRFEKLWIDFETRFQKQILKAKGVAKCFVKLKFSDFQRTSRESSSKVVEFAVFKEMALEAFQRSNKAVRLIGIGVRFEVTSRKHSHDPRQLSLFESPRRQFPQAV